MLYLTGTVDSKTLSLVILETANIEELKKGKPTITHDGRIVLCWTPDADWLAERIKESNGDMSKILDAIEQSTKRPQQPPRAFFPTEHTYFG